MKPHVRTALLVGAALLIGAGAGYLAGSQVSTDHYRALFTNLEPIQQSNNTYTFIAPLLSYRVPEATELGQYTALKTAMQSEITKATASGAIFRASVYFRDLNTSAWVGINHNDTYYPASLLKLPVMIAYLKEAENDPGMLSERIVYRNQAPDDPYDASSTLAEGASYTVKQLIEQMIASSDNGATFALLANIDQHTLAGVYGDLGINDPGSDSSQYQISSRTYGLFFRVLYNATYLSPEYSQMALELLAKATFADGLMAGVPSGTPVAHKFGEHVITTNQVATGIELSDCGVAYYPKHPYLLCVMTSAKDVPSATNIIKNISATAYNAVAKEYPAE